jgi:hypothetical protein
MFKNSMTPQSITRPTPSRPGVVYTQRGQEFARIMAGARR